MEDLTQMLEQSMTQPVPLPEPVTETVGEVVPTTPMPEKPPQLTAKQIGQLRRMWVTNANGTVTACGHKDNFSKTEKREGKQPNNNCIYCWEAYFMTSVDLDFIHAVLTQKGGKALVALKGTKFVKMFHGFLSTKMLPMLQAEINKENTAPAEAPAQILGGTFGVQEASTREAAVDGNTAVPSL
jgi:hypothetical protein